MDGIMPSAANVIDALNSHRPGSGYVWMPDGLLYVTRLFPDSAIACALAEHGVWNEDERDSFLDPSGRPHDSRGIRSDSFYIDIQDEAYERAAGVIDEIDVARALNKHFNAQLTDVGIDPDALVNVTQHHVVHQSAMRQRWETSQARLLSRAVSSQALRRMLSPSAEDQGWVDWKRSLGHGPARIEGTLVSLVNANPLTAVHVVFGVDDDGTIVGQVDLKGEPMDDSTAQKCRDAITAQLGQTDPATIVRWRRTRRGSNVLSVLSAMGRQPGTVVRTNDGRFPVRSGGHTRYLRAPEIAALLRRPSFLGG
jgi:hypothetical protein